VNAGAAGPAAPPAERAFVGLGANLGDAARAVGEALAEIAAVPGVTVVAVSPRYRTAPVDAGGPDFCNAVAELRASIEPAALLEAMLAIERRHGRQRPFRNAPRTIDLDLLLFGTRVLDTPRLVLPHPRMHLRAFVLRPLLDLAPEVTIPGLGPAASWLAGAAGQGIRRWEPNP
jgi:2-amino-4-hydroxy-6-hydroxymethyldihydropteridine diphosphokinase